MKTNTCIPAILFLFFATCSQGIGQLSDSGWMQFRGPNQSDAKDVLMDAQGDFDLAIELLVTKRHSLIDRLMDEGMFTEEQVIQVSFYLLTHPKCLANF